MLTREWWERVTERYLPELPEGWEYGEDPLTAKTDGLEIDASDDTDIEMTYDVQGPGTIYQYIPYKVLEALYLARKIRGPE